MSGSVERKALERRADALGIPWTFSTPDADLLALITERDRRMSVSQQAELRNGVLYIDGLSQPEECFGVFWAAVGDEECVTCMFKDYCLEKFVQTTLPKAKKKAKTLPGLVKALGLPEEAVNLALQKMVMLERQAQQPEPPKAEPPPPEEPAKKKKPPKQTVEQPKKKRRPPKAGASVKRASAPASTTTAKSARSAKARAALPQADEARMLKRWLRERRKNKLIGKLVPDMLLRKTWKEHEYEVKVCQGYYLYGGEKYATLYEVTGEITGWREYPKQMVDGVRPEGTRRMSAWSPSRFWELPKLVAQLGKVA